ncbi:hypothetical protein V1478_003460 [Vespula squamosa]|uniref:Uncharacterized protein n=1 Tax=Vespula squamosa TaxID=30214 RepID=A0ABD2BLX3_VESSQ
MRFDFLPSTETSKELLWNLLCGTLQLRVHSTLNHVDYMIREEVARQIVSPPDSGECQNFSANRSLYQDHMIREEVVREIISCLVMFSYSKFQIFDKANIFPANKTL